MRNVMIIFGSLTLFAATPAAAQQLPSDVDLRAAYCLRLLALQLEPAAGLAAQVAKVEGYEAIAAEVARSERELKARHARLYSYLMPRIPQLSPVPIVTAAKQADADLAAREEEQKACVATSGEELACARKVVEQHPSTAAMSRCDNLAWLPY